MLPSVLVKTAIPLPMDGIAAFCNKWGITEFSLFGSVLRDDFGPDSDIDVLVAYAPNASISLFTKVEMRDELEKLFGRRVDLVTRRAIERARQGARRRAILYSARVIHGA